MTPRVDPAPAFRQGLRAGVTIVPSFLAIFAGYGLASQVAGMPALAALALTLGVFAAPAQFAMLELAHRGSAAVAQMIVAGILVNLRFFVMSLTLSHLFTRAPRRKLLLSAQFVIASAYLLTFFRSRRTPAIDLHAYFRGIAAVALPVALLGTALGIVFGAGLPAAFAFGATLFLPVYFALLLATDVKGAHEIAAVLAGLLLTPPAEYWLPGWGAFIVALLAGGILVALER